MNANSLHALIVDQHFGELPAEVVELLEDHLAAHPAARNEAARIRETLGVTASAVIQHPDLARVESAETSRVPQRQPGPNFAWLAKAAAITMLAAVTGAGGYFAGRKQAPTFASVPVAAEESPRPPRKDSPWARYRFEPDRDGTGRQIVRVDVSSSTGGALR